MLTVIAQGKMKSKKVPTKANAKMMRQKPLSEQRTRYARWLTPSVCRVVTVQ